MDNSRLRKLNASETQNLERLYDFFGRNAGVFLDSFNIRDTKNVDKHLRTVFLRLFASKDSAGYIQNLHTVETFYSFFASSAVATEFFANFDPKQNHRRQSRLTFINLFTSPGHMDRIPALLALLDNANFTACLTSFTSPEVLLNALNILLPVDEFLDATLPKPMSDRLSAKSVSSSITNNKFTLDTLKCDEIILANAGKSKIGLMWTKFNAAMKGIKQHFYDITYSKFVQLEGDVADICLVNILLPVVQVMNAFLDEYCQNSRDGDEYGWEVSVRAQYRNRNKLVSNPLTHYIDHCLVLHARGCSSSMDIPLVIFEEKNIGTIELNEWRSFSELTRKSPKVIPGPGEVEYKHMYRIVPQLRKYVFEVRTPYAMTSDARSHIAMIWGAGKNWKNAEYVEPYGKEFYTALEPHHFRFMPCMNSQNRRCPSPRRVLAFLCYLALHDNGFRQTEAK